MKRAPGIRVRDSGLRRPPDSDRRTGAERVTARARAATLAGCRLQRSFASVRAPRPGSPPAAGSAPHLVGNVDRAAARVTDLRDGRERSRWSWPRHRFRSRVRRHGGNEAISPARNSFDVLRALPAIIERLAHHRNCCARLFGSTNASGQTDSSNSSRFTTCPARSTRTRSVSTAFGASASDSWPFDRSRAAVSSCRVRRCSDTDEPGRSEHSTSSLFHPKFIAA